MNQYIGLVVAVSAFVANASSDKLIENAPDLLNALNHCLPEYTKLVREEYRVERVRFSSARPPKGGRLKSTYSIFTLRDGLPVERFGQTLVITTTAESDTSENADSQSNASYSCEINRTVIPK